MDYKNLFEQDVFKDLNKETLKEFQILSENIKNQDSNTAILHIMEFYKRNAGKQGLSSKQTKLLIDTIVEKLNPNEKKQFLSILDIVLNMV